MNKIKYPDSYITWDLETTGLDFVNNRIIEIGAITVKNNEIVDERSWLLNYNIEIPDFITNITKITKEIIDSEGQDPVLCINEFLNMLNTSSSYLAHNGTRFDIPFLIEQATRTLNSSKEYRERISKKLYASSFDTAVLIKAQKLNMQRQWNETFKEFADRVMEIRAFGVKYNVAICCEELGIDKSDVQQHRALGDVKLTHRIYQELKKQQPK